MLGSNSDVTMRKPAKISTKARTNPEAGHAATIAAIKGVGSLHVTAMAYSSCGQNSPQAIEPCQENGKAVA